MWVLLLQVVIGKNYSLVASAPDFVFGAGWSLAPNLFVKYIIMEKKFYPHMVGKEVLVDGEYGKVTSAWEYVGVENATLWFNVRLEDGSFSVTDSWDCTDLEDCNII